MPVDFKKDPSSYRDPAGFIFLQEGVFYRQVNLFYKEDYDHLVSGGCYESLQQKQLLLPHEEITGIDTGDPEAYRILKPAQLPFVSYPYEWSFSMLKDAALLTLKVLKESIKYGMILKDASAYNIQWWKDRMVFIDTLSFERYDPAMPWIAYRQFCEQFLAPLLLSHYAKQHLPKLLQSYPEGIPLTIASALLPWKTRLSLHIYLHIHLNAKFSTKKPAAGKPVAFSEKKLLDLVKSLELLINKLQVHDQPSTWSDYYDEAAQREDYLDVKKKTVHFWLEKKLPASVADLGANTGEFSKMAAAKGMMTIAADFDPFCIERLYRDIKTEHLSNIHPLIVDLAAPTPALGVNNEERASFLRRSSVDCCMMLAVIHHLCIGKNIPFEKIASALRDLCKVLIIEFVPKSDEKVILMLKGKKDIYVNYTRENFEKEFNSYFLIEEERSLGDHGRTLYLMQKR